MHQSQVRWCLAITDGVIFLLAWLLTFLVMYITSGSSDDVMSFITTPTAISGVLVIIIVSIFSHLGHYVCHQPWFSQWGEVVKLCGIALLVDYVLHYHLVSASYLWSISFWGVVLALLPVGRRAVYCLFCYLEGWHIDVTIIGHAKACMRSVLVLHAQRYLGYRIRHIIVLDSDDEWDAHHMPAGLDDCTMTFEPLSPPNSVLEVTTELTLIAPEHIPMGPELNACMNELEEQRMDYILIKPLELQPSSMYRAQPMVGQQLWLKGALFANLSRPISTLVKRMFDLFVSASLLLLLSPYMLYLALRIGRDGGPVLQQVRTAGNNGNEFVRYQFRTQVKDPDQALANLVQQDPYAQKLLDANQPLPFDPRISALGRTMLQTGVHRLPQLWNVLKGDMSMVGPGPIGADQLEKHLSYFVASYSKLRPGICSIELPYDQQALGDDQRAAIIKSYCQHWCLSSDLASCMAKLNIS